MANRMRVRIVKLSDPKVNYDPNIVAARVNAELQENEWILGMKRVETGRLVPETEQVSVGTSPGAQPTVVGAVEVFLIFYIISSSAYPDPATWRGTFNGINDLGGV